jgi:predicted small secreted protein
MPSLAGTAEAISQEGGIRNVELDVVKTFLGNEQRMKRRVSMRRTWIVLCAMVLIAGLTAGCATSNAIGDARAQLAKAKDAGAVWSAPFEYYAAEAYLGKAVFSAEIGDTTQADIFTKQSAGYSAKALEMAKGGAK